MGTDITVHIERFNGKCWCNYTEYEWCRVTSSFESVSLTSQRWYAMFSRLAGVRADDGSPTQLSAQRGMPADADPKTVEEFENEGGYGQSWYLLSELRENKDVYLEPIIDAADNLIKRRLWYCGDEERREMDTKFRVIFWFDC